MLKGIAILILQKNYDSYRYRLQQVISLEAEITSRYSGFEIIPPH